MRKLTQLRITILVFLFIFSLFTAPAFADADMKKEGGPGSDSEEKCPPRQKNKLLFDDKVFFIPFTQPSVKGRVAGLYTKYAEFGGRFSGFPELLLMVPTRLMGLCDWWPEKLEWVWGVGNQAFMSDESPTVRLVAWNLRSEVRWYISPDMYASYGWQHWSFGGLENSFSERFIAEHKIDAESQVGVRDIIFFRFAHQLPCGSWNCQYYIESTPWQATFYDTFKSLLNSDTRTPYDYAGGFGFHLSRPIRSKTGISFMSRGEYSSKKIPYVFEGALDSFSSSAQTSGVSLFYQLQNGAGEGAVRNGSTGVEIDSRIIGVRLFVKASSF